MGREIRRVPLDWNGWEDYDSEEEQGNSPEGDAFQLWETCGDNPISPPFATKTELRSYIIEEMKCDLGGIFDSLSIEAVDALLEEEFVPSFVFTSRGVMNGAEFAALKRKQGK